MTRNCATNSTPHLRLLEHQDIISGWHDCEISPGADWRGNILQELESADIILLLVSAEFLASDFCYGVEMERALQRHAAGTARVVPIILSPCDWQESPLGELQALPEDAHPVILRRPRAKAWDAITRSLRGVADEIRKARSDQPDAAASQESPRPSLTRQEGKIPLQVFLETGTVPVDSPFYVEREADQLAAQQLDSREPTVIIKGHRQSGKSSLLARLHDRAMRDGLLSCYLTFQGMDAASVANTDEFFRQLAWMVADKLDATVDPDELWSDRRGVKQNLSRYLEKAVLAPSDVAVQILFDEVDVVFESASTRTDLFSMIRTWHNDRATDPKGNWKKLRLVIAHATEPALWIADLNQSPFNVGLNLTMPDFDLLQLADLNQRYGSPLSSDVDLRRLEQLVGGHPYLVRLALYDLAKNQRSIEELEHLAARADGPFAPHLDRYWMRLSENPQLAAAVRQVIQKGTCNDERMFSQLWASGLVRGDERGAVAMRCRLYQDYFERRLS